MVMFRTFIGRKCLWVIEGFNDPTRLIFGLVCESNHVLTIQNNGNIWFCGVLVNKVREMR